MSNGDVPSIGTPCPATASRSTSGVKRSVRWLRQLLLICTAIIAIHLPTHAGATAAMPRQATQVESHISAGWSCRGIYHVVRRGETIYSIARRYGTTAYRIAVCNGLTSYTVYVGQTLLVPTAR